MTHFERIMQQDIIDCASERIHFVENQNGADYYEGDFGSVDCQYEWINGIRHDKNDACSLALKKEIEWLNSPCEE